MGEHTRIGRSWYDLNFARVKRLEFERITSNEAWMIYRKRILRQKIYFRFNSHMKEVKKILRISIQVEKVGYSLSIGHNMYYCFIERFNLSDKSIVITYKDDDDLNSLPHNLHKTELIGLQGFIKTRNRKGMHFSPTKEGHKMCIDKAKWTRVKTVSQYEQDGEHIATYESISEAARVTGINLTSIIAAANKKRNAAGGFVWR